MHGFCLLVHIHLKFVNFIRIFNSEFASQFLHVSTMDAPNFKKIKTGKMCFKIDFHIFSLSTWFAPCILPTCS